MKEGLPRNIVPRIIAIVLPSSDGGDALRCWPGLNLARVKGYRAVKLCIYSEVVVKVLKDGKTRSVVG
ncbi:hypothetical protein A2U01_0032968 [Trifolium medium]|uniref:Uncharacterized protein n=1 Tax=Trifolium medium TaxID=97028 RepID=A0A392PKP3_9FABA|nr:hypothetical protein [Trifolium medium]